MMIDQEKYYANIGSQLCFNKSFDALLEEAKQSGVVITEKEVQALIRTGKRQIELGLPIPEEVLNGIID